MTIFHKKRRQFSTFDQINLVLRGKAFFFKCDRLILLFGGIANLANGEKEKERKRQTDTQTSGKKIKTKSESSLVQKKHSRVYRKKYWNTQGFGAPTI